MILNNKTMWQCYEQLKTEAERNQFLKDYLLGLPPDELANGLENDLNALGFGILEAVDKGNLTVSDSRKVSADLKNIAEQLRQMTTLTKAA